jgi:protoporphyrinogen oxidase
VFKPKAGKNKDKVIKTLIDSFRYPKYGPGMMWETCTAKCKEMGVRVEMNCGVKDISTANNKWAVDTTWANILKDLIMYCHPLLCAN